MIPGIFAEREELQEVAINGASSVQYNNTQKFLYEINANSTAKRCYIHSKSSETFFVHGGQWYIM